MKRLLFLIAVGAVWCVFADDVSKSQTPEARTEKAVEMEEKDDAPWFAPELRADRMGVFAKVYWCHTYDLRCVMRPSTAMAATTASTRISPGAALASPSTSESGTMAMNA